VTVFFAQLIVWPQEVIFPALVSILIHLSLSAYRLPIDDILHARIQTMGVAEHQFEVPLHGKTVTWHLYDVGGARGQRHTWVSYFEEANAIIFVAPISAFDQVRKEL
jgi:guanine nucleotide-binding protein alpha-1 subunit